MAQNMYAGTKTEQNLKEAFAGESMARNKYTFFANVARDNGFEQIASIFDETAGNEQEHAELWAEELGYITDNTAENLMSAAEGENYEWTDMYRKMAAEAAEEGFSDLARRFSEVGNIERSHETRYLRLLRNVLNGTVFHKPEKVLWQCRVCGYQVFGESAPEECPVCGHKQAFFQLKPENY